MIDVSRLKSPCHICSNIFLDKTKDPCDSCKDRILYDAILCGISQEEFEQWYHSSETSLMNYRCDTKGCFRRVSKKGQKCTRCQRINGKEIKRKFENEQDILIIEKIMTEFVDHCEKRFKNLTIAAKEFGVNPTYIYTIKNFEVYPSKSMLYAMQRFIELN